MEERSGPSGIQNWSFSIKIASHSLWRLDVNHVSSTRLKTHQTLEAIKLKNMSIAIYKLLKVKKWISEEYRYFTASEWKIKEAMSITQFQRNRAAQPQQCWYTWVGISSTEEMPRSCRKTSWSTEFPIYIKQSSPVSRRYIPSSVTCSLESGIAGGRIPSVS